MVLPRPGADDTPPDDGPAFEGSVGFLLSRTGALARRSWTQMCSERDITPHQYGLLMAIGELGGTAGQQRLTELLGVDPRNAVPIIDVLVDRGLLTRTIDPSDRRRRVLALTHSGRDMVTDLTRAGTTIEDHFLQALTRTDRNELRRILLLLSRATEPENDSSTM